MPDLIGVLEAEKDSKLELFGECELEDVCAREVLIQTV